MLKKIPLRLRLTLLSLMLLTACCAGLTAVINYSAYQMADTIEAVPLLPAAPAEETSPPAETAVPVEPAVTVEARQDFFSESLLWMIGVVIFGGAFTWYLAGKALTPLHELNFQMKKRTQHNLSERLPVPTSHDEIASLTVSFNEMNAKLDDAFSTQRRFSQSAAHELRTPLTVLKTKLDVFRKKPDRSREEYDALLNIFDVQTDRLSGLVSELLSLTSLDALNCDEEVILAPMLSEILEELGLLAARQDVTLSLSCDTYSVKGNLRLLHRAVCNLVENAIKYNRPKGRVHLSVKADQGKTYIMVKDTGPGIAEVEKTMIFEPFYRADKSRSRSLGGAGLGLSTAKTIIDKHGGQIRITDNPEGGTVFTIILNSQ